MVPLTELLFNTDATVADDIRRTPSCCNCDTDKMDVYMA